LVSCPNIIYSILDIVQLPENVMEYKGHLILHVSDTPSSFYPCFRRLISRLMPSWIIHTGDLVDEVKIGLHRRDLDLYRRKLLRIRDIMEGPDGPGRRNLLVTLGNHDDEGTARSVFSESTGISDSFSVDIEGLSVNCDHYLARLDGGPSTINLYGHDPAVPAEGGKQGVFLNGLNSINLITLPHGVIYSLPYPRYVNDHRQLKHRRSL